MKKFDIFAYYTFLTFPFESTDSSVVCKSSELRLAEHGSLYLEGQAHKGWV